MTITNSHIAIHILNHIKSRIGTIHFFEHLAVLEFYDGAHIDLNSFRKTINNINLYYGPNQPYGLLCNIVNSYSIDLLDITKIPSLMPNLVAYGIVTHNEAGRMSADLQSGFCNLTNISFSNLYEGFNAIYQRVKKSEHYLKLSESQHSLQ
jgi:hypothetical protein